jgi:enterochelin esterase-like enzyme
MKNWILTIGCFVCLHFLPAQTIQRSQVITEFFRASSIEGNLAGEDPNRRLTIYLPPGYDSRNTRYPVIYFLHGFPVDDSICMAEFNLRILLDSAIQTGRMKPVIVVLPNSYTRFRGSLYTNSPFTGKWADFIRKDVVGFVDRKYRTIPDRLARGLAGHSMGGYGALKLGMLYSDVFSVVYSLSPGGLDWGPYFNLGNRAFKKLQFTGNGDDVMRAFDTLSWDWVTNNDFYAMLFTVFGRAFAQQEDNLPFYGSLPVTYVGDSMIINAVVLRNWESNFINNMVDAHIPALRALTALKIDWGRSDEIPFITGNCLRFSEKLEAYGIAHFAESYAGDHGSKLIGWEGRINTEVLPFFNHYLKFE